MFARRASTRPPSAVLEKYTQQINSWFRPNPQPDRSDRYPSLSPDPFKAPGPVARRRSLSSPSPSSSCPLSASTSSDSEASTARASTDTDDKARLAQPPRQPEPRDRKREQRVVLERLAGLLERAVDALCSALQQACDGVADSSIKRRPSAWANQEAQLARLVVLYESAFLLSKKTPTRFLNFRKATSDMAEYACQAKELAFDLVEALEDIVGPDPASHIHASVLWIGEYFALALGESLEAIDSVREDLGGVAPAGSSSSSSGNRQSKAIVSDVTNQISMVSAELGRFRETLPGAHRVRRRTLTWKNTAAIMLYDTERKNTDPPLRLHVDIGDAAARGR